MMKFANIVLAIAPLYSVDAFMAHAPNPVDGKLRPFRGIVQSPRSFSGIAIRNTGQVKFPLTAGLEPDMSPNITPFDILISKGESHKVQGGDVYTAPFPPSVQSVEIALISVGRELHARIELLQGPNNIKQVMNIYTEDGQERPFYTIIDTSLGSGNSVRIVNTGTLEFPLTATVEAYIVDDSIEEDTSANGGMTWR